MLEERLNSPSYAERQNVWGLRYIDDLVLRDRDGDGNSGTGNYGLSGSGLEERLYALQDANWNVVSISNPSSGTIQERYCYTAYGRSTVLRGIFGSRGTSSYDWEVRYTGRPLDKDTGFQENRNRWFVGYLGRWLSRDPIGYEAGDVNLYRYCEGKAPTATDSQGSQGPGGDYRDFPFACCPPPYDPRYPSRNGPVEWSGSTNCPNLKAALEILNAVINDGSCQRWFENRRVCHNATPPNDYDVWVVPDWMNGGAAAHTIPLVGNNIYLSKSWCYQPVGVLASILIHEVAHHYCPSYGEAGETCANQGQQACENEALDAARRAGHSGFPLPQS